MTRCVKQTEDSRGTLTDWNKGSLKQSNLSRSWKTRKRNSRSTWREKHGQEWQEKSAVDLQLQLDKAETRCSEFESYRVEWSEELIHFMLRKLSLNLSHSLLTCTCIYMYFIHSLFWRCNLILCDTFKRGIYMYKYTHHACIILIYMYSSCNWPAVVWWYSRLGQGSQ